MYLISIVFASCIISVYIESMLYNLVKYIVGKILGQKFMYFSFLGICIMVENQKICIRLTEFTSFPRLLMIDDIDGTMKQYKHQMIINIVYVLADLCVGFGIFFWSKRLTGIHYSIWWTVAGLILIMVLVYMIKICVLINKIFGKGPEARWSKESARIMGMLSCGHSPGCINIEDWVISNSFSKSTPTHWGIDMVAYYHDFDLLKMDDLYEKHISRMEQLVDEYKIATPSQMFLLRGVLYELIYYYSSVCNDTNKAEQYKIIVGSELDKDMDINGRRVYAAYLYYAGKDKSTALEVAKQGLAVKDKFSMKGQALFEEKLINKLIMQMQNS